jgi:hypothetical protein
MKLVELWVIGGIDSDNYLILTPSSDVEYRVLNGEYDVIPDKDNNKITIIMGRERCTFGYPNETHEAHYLGDIKWISTNDDWDRDCAKRGYNLTIRAYEETKEIVGKNLIPKLAKRVITKEEEWEEEEPAF